jgi:transposase
MLLKTGSKHRSNVQGNEENSNRKPVFNKSVSIKRLSESVNIATVKRLLLKSETNIETEMNFWILPICYFFGIENVRVGDKILGSVDQKPIFFFDLSII